MKGIEMNRGLSTPAAALAGLLLGCMVGIGPAHAQAGNPEAEAACTPDVMRLCNEYIPDRGRIVSCMRAKRHQLSRACRVFFAGKKKRRS
jgi:hypothetical protein